MILVNFKIYKEAFGDNAVKLAGVCREVMKETGVEIVPVVSALDVYRIKKELGIKVFIQNVDEYDEGAKNGWISPLQAKETGADGALINHSEHKIKPGTIKKILAKWPEGMTAVVCLQTLGQTERWARKLKADWVAYEPSYLIGDKERSVATEKPEAIKKIVEKYSPIGVLAGAGIHNKSDVEIALRLGAKGILVSSDVVKAENPRNELLELANGFKMV